MDEPANRPKGNKIAERVPAGTDASNWVTTVPADELDEATAGGETPEQPEEPDSD